MVKIIVDSGSDMTRELAEKLDVAIVPLHIKHEENTFLDRVDIEPDQLYDLLEGSSVLPHTSQPSPAAFMSVFGKYPDEDIVVLTIAKELSGTFQSANLAKQISERNNIYIADTRQVTLPLMDLVLEACALRDQGKGAEEIVQNVEALRDTVRIIAVVDTLDYLQKGGRLSKTAAAAGNFLKIKPVIGVKDGAVEVLAKARGKKSVMAQILNLLEKDEVDLDHAYFGYTGKDAGILEEFSASILERYPFRQTDSFQIGAAIGTHAGPGAKAIVYRISKKEN